MTLRSLLPRKLASQLIGLLLVALTIGQFVNLMIIVGERQVIKRANLTAPVSAEIVQLSDRLPDLETVRLPYVLRHSPQAPRGAYFISESNRAVSAPDRKRQSDMEAVISRRLDASNVFYFSVSASIVTFDDKKRSGDLRRLQNGPPDGIPNRRAGPPRPGETGERLPPTRFRPSIGPDRGGPPGTGMRELIVSVELEPGIYFNTMIPYYAFSSMTHRIMMATGILIGLTILLAAWFAHRLTRPLTALADASVKLGRGETLSEPLPEKGPQEVKRAAKAFNDMNERLTRLLTTQQSLLRAVGHDLRTPITSLRLRAEAIEDDALRERFIATLADMTLMTEDILNWAKDASGVEEKAATDLQALLDSQIEDYRDQGHKISFNEGLPLVLPVRRVAIKRAVQNLLDNALKFAGSADVNLRCMNGEAVIEVCDDGPGIPEGQIDDVMAPFSRGEPSRARKTGGIGLGLSIAQTIAQSHGGRLALRNRKSGGLCAAIHLPLH